MGDVTAALGDRGVTAALGVQGAELEPQVRAQRALAGAGRGALPVLTDVLQQRREWKILLPLPGRIEVFLGLPKTEAREN